MEVGDDGSALVLPCPNSLRNAQFFGFLHLHNVLNMQYQAVHELRVVRPGIICVHHLQTRDLALAVTSNKAAVILAGSTCLLNSNRFFFTVFSLSCIDLKSKDDKVEKLTL
jgi:hypothetical protein